MKPRVAVVGAGLVTLPVGASSLDSTRLLGPVPTSPRSVTVWCTWLATWCQGKVTDPDDTRRQLTELAQRMGVKEHQVAKSRYLHRMTVAYGQPLAEHGGLAGRPPVDVLDNPRLAVAEDRVGPTELLADASLASGNPSKLTEPRATQPRSTDWWERPARPLAGPQKTASAWVGQTTRHACSCET